MKNIVVRVNDRQWIYIRPISNGSVNPFKRKDVNQNASEPDQFNMQMYCIVLRAHPRCNHVGVTHTQASLVPLTTPYIITLWLPSWDN